MASRPEDPVAAAAKVIRIIHNDHAAQSRYLHALKVTPGESHLETKSVLQCMEQEEYQDVLTDLEPPQKATFFDKVAAMSEKPSETPMTLDKETTKLYFEALGLSAKGLSFKDVRAEIEKRSAMTTSTLAQSTAAPKLPFTPPTSKPYRETKIEVKELNPKDKPAQKAVKPAAPVAPKAPTAPASKQQKEKKDNKDKRDRKRKREDDTPKTSKKPKTEPEVPVGGSKKRQKRREKQRALLGKVAAGEVPPVSKPAVQEAPKTEKTLPVAPLSASEEQRTVDEKMQLDSSEPAPLKVSEPAPSESTVQANPKSKKVRRSKHKSEKTKSKPVETEQPIQPSAPEPSTILETEISAQVEGSKKSRNRRARKAKVAEIPVTIPPPPVAPVAREDSVPAEDPAPTEDASTSSSDEADNDDDLPAKEGTMSDFIRRTTLPMLGRPTISATADPSSDHEDEQEMTSASVEHKEANEGKAVPGEADKESNSEVTHEQALLDQIQREISSEALREESPSPPTRETSVSSHEKVPSPPRQQEQKKSSPVIKKTELPKAAPSSFTSAPSQSSLHRPTLSNSFSKPQSSFTSTRSLSILSTNTNTKKSGTDAYAEFSAFVSGKKLGYDSSDDDDDSSSSSSDSDDERPAPVQTRKSSPVQLQPYKAPSISPIAAPEPEVEPSAMDVDTEVGATPKHTDPVMPAIDVVMTNEEENVSSPMEYNDSPTSIQEETENVGVEATDDNSAAFQSFHESSVPKDAPLKQVPLPDIPSPEALMEFGGYQPSTTEATGATEATQETEEIAPITTQEQNQPIEPVNLGIREGPEVVDAPGSLELEAESEGDDEALHALSEAGEQASSSPKDEQITEPAEETTPAEGKDVETEETAQPSDLDADAEEPVVDEQVLEAAEEVDEPENQEAEAETEDIAQSSHSDSEPEEPAEAFTNSMKDFLAAWEEEVDNFENRVEELRQLLVEDGDGSAEDNKDILEKLMNEVDREENIYKKKTTTARNALGGLERLARIKILEVLDRADASFERRVMVVKDKLREEHNGESARSQLSPDTEESDVEMKDVPDLETKPNVESEDSDDEQADSPVESGSPAPSSLGWAPSEDEGLTESAKKETKVKTRKPRKSTGATSEHFTPSPKKKRVPAGTSAVPFPKLSAPRFGLIQERLANDPFRLLIAVTFLNKTAGRAAVPIFEQVMETYPTPANLAAANVSELSEMIHSLGFQNQRARKLIKIAETWIEQPPQKGRLHRTMDYPNKGNGRHLKPKETVDEDVEDCIEAGALEIAHIYGLGPYAWDSWRIFCRDVFRGVAEGYNGEGVTGYKSASQANDEAEFEPEWKRVVPLDKELRACLRWMWLREGWEWDPLTGNKKKAAPTLMREASDGVATWNEPVALGPHEDTTTIKEELEGPKGPEALVPGVKAEDAAPAPKRRTRRGRNSSGAAAKKRTATPPPAAPKEAATPIVPPSAKRLNADPEIMTSRLRPRAGRTDVIVSIPVAPTPSRRRVARK